MRLAWRDSVARCRRRIEWSVILSVPVLIAVPASAQSLRYRPCSCGITASVPSLEPPSARTIPIPEFPSRGGGHAGRGALIGLAIGVGSGFGLALLLNEVAPPGEVERWIGLPFLLGIWGLLVGYGVGRGT